jgi:hypothetical protein
MNSIKFKIKGYDEATNSLLISFASDTTASPDPESYPAYAFQPLTMWPGATTVDELKKQIAIVGVHQAQIQEDKEKFNADPARQAALQALVGQTVEYAVADLTAASNTTPLQTV